jgi:hypothetical protein
MEVNMHRPAWTEILAMGLALALSTAPALAAGDKEQPTAGGAEKSDPSAMPRGADAGDFTGRHTMSGEVTQVDQNKGKLQVKTQEGTLDLHFPSSALQNVKKGDRVSVELALKPDTGGSASPRTEPGASPKGPGGSQR